MMIFKSVIFKFNIKKQQVVILLLLITNCAFATVKLPEIIADNMILQQKTTITFWGWAAPGENVIIDGNWTKKSYKAIANAKGEWAVAIPTPAASTTKHNIFFKGDNNSIHIQNVLFGEVWLCSGQSNMEFTMAKGPRPWETGVYNFEAEVAKVNNPNIREFTVDEVAADTLTSDTKGEWLEANQTNVRLFSAVAYYYAREIYEKTGFPVGLINATWGGTPAESWTNKKVLQADPDLNKILLAYQQKVADLPQAMEKYNVALAKWKADTAMANKQHLSITKAPAKPAVTSPNSVPGKLYNGMIVPVVNYTIKGVIWYQGESNADRGWQYRKLFPALIKSWRDDHHNQNLPFYFVQISPHKSSTAEIREAQLYTYQTLTHTGMVVTTDNGDSSNIHPRNKEIVGKRLALWPLKHDYGFKDISYSGPIYKSMKTEVNNIRIYFDKTTGGLIAKDGDLKEFTIAGDDHIFHTAQAKIDGNTLIVSSELVKNPIAVRFAWRAVPLPNLYNKDGLPASPFRTDSWPVPSQEIPINNKAN